MKKVVLFSGGKDSTALLIWTVKKYDAKNVVALFADTGWEHPLNYEYIDKVANRLGVELVKVKSKEYGGIIDLIRKKKIFPSQHRRICTYYLKILPSVDYLVEHKEDIDIVFIGIRKLESGGRMKKYIDVKPDRVYTYRKFIHLKKADGIKVQYPLIDWTKEKVIAFIRDNGFELNPLYELYDRVGCFPCVISEKSIRESLAVELGRKRFMELVDLERELREQGFNSRIFPSNSDRRVKKLKDKMYGMIMQETLDRWYVGGDVYD